MRTLLAVPSILFISFFASCLPGEQGKNEISSKFEYDIKTPVHCKRFPQSAAAFGSWLRELPLKKDKKVHLYNGELKENQEAQFAIIDMEIGNRDLEQCADAVIRLRAEYLYHEKRLQEIFFHFNNGSEASFLKYAAGFRPIIKGNVVSWKRSAAGDSSYKTFRAYLDLVFTYAGTAALYKDLRPLAELKDIQPGDVFIQRGTPYGHAVIVADVAVDSLSGRKYFMLAQSFMPAQEIHILKNPSDEELSPWYAIPETEEFETPEWTFAKTDLRRF
jgi:hypothetical protein